MPPTIIMQPTNPPPPKKSPNVDPKGSFVLTFQGFTEGQEIEVALFEINESLKANNHDKDTKLGTVKGKLTKHLDTPNGPVFTLTPTSNSTETFGPARMSFSFPVAQAHSTKDFLFNIHPSATSGQNEGDYWEIQAQVTDPLVQSATFNVARVNRALPTRTADPKATYDWHAGNDVVFYHDGSVDKDGSGGAFDDVGKAIDAAKHFVFIADWSFHPYMRLHHSDPATVVSSIGQKLIDKANADPNFLVAIHTWDHTNAGAADSQNDDAKDILANIAGGKRPANLLWRASSRTGQNGGAGFGWSHHQKYVIVDCAGPNGRREIKVFYGGLDLTKGRFDWPGHPILPDATAGSDTEFFLQKISGIKIGFFKNSNQDYDDWYNAEFNGPAAEGDATLPRQPWHDIHAQLTGPSAWDVVREFVGRWNLDPTLTPTQGDNNAAAIKKVDDKFTSLFEKNGDTFKFVLPFEDRDGKWSAQVYRSIVREHWGSNTTITSPMLPDGEFQWKLKQDVESSIQEAYIKAMRLAEKFIYIESQYFIGSGKHWGRNSVENRLPEEIVNRINIQISNKKPFHAYIVMPMYPEGDPTDSASRSQRIFEFKTMEYMMQTVQAKCDQINDLNPDGDVLIWSDFLSFYFLANWTDQKTKDGKPKGVVFSTKPDKEKRKDQLGNNQRYMIYVHSKMMIVDDRYVIVGSANLNERSLAGGRDTEICIGVWPSNDRVAPDCIQQVQNFRQELWTEHFGAGMTGVIPDWQKPEFAGQQCILEGRKNYNQMRFCQRAAADGHICNFPLILDKNNKLAFDNFKMYAGLDAAIIPDGIVGKDDWKFIPSGGGAAIHTDIPE